MEPPKIRILNTASRLFYEQGFHVTGINQIIAEANVAKASFYQHYASKEELGRQYINSLVEQKLVFYSEELKKYPAGQERMMSLLMNLEREVRHDNYKGCPFMNMATEFKDSEHPIRKAVQKQKNNIKDYIYNCIKEGHPSLSLQEVEDKSAVIYLLYESAKTEAYLVGDTSPVQAARKAVNAII